MKDYSVQLAKVAHFPNQAPRQPGVAYRSSGNGSMVGGQRQKTKRSKYGGKPGSKSPPAYSAEADEG